MKRDPLINFTSQRKVSNPTTTDSAFSIFHSQFSPLAFTRQDKKKKVTFESTNKEEKAISIDVNLDYEYNYDNIKLVWQKRKECLQKWFESQGIAHDEQVPIVVPGHEIRRSAAYGAIDNLTTYLEHYVCLDSVKTEYNKQRRLVYVPVNEGSRHWVTLFLFVNENNNIRSAMFIDSLGGEPLCKKLLSAMKNDLAYTIPKAPELYNELNKTGKKLTSHLSTVLAEENRYVQLLRAADPTFRRSVERRYHLLQSDNKACGVFSIENAIACVRAAYLGKNYTVQPFWCNEDTTAQFRAHHVKLLGIDHPFNGIQRENLQDVTDHNYMSQLMVTKSLNGAGKLVVNSIKQLDTNHQQCLQEAFTEKAVSGELHEEHSEHLKRIRGAIISIKDDLLKQSTEIKREEELIGGDESRKDKQREDSTHEKNRQKIVTSERQLQQKVDAFNTILQAISGNQWSFETIASIKADHSWDLPIKLEGEFQQLLEIGRELVRQSKSSQFSFSSLFSGSLFGKGNGPTTRRWGSSMGSELSFVPSTEKSSLSGEKLKSAASSELSSDSGSDRARDTSFSPFQSSV